MANTETQDSRLIQAIRKQATQWLADEAWDKKLLREKDDKSIPYGVPTPQWYRSKIKEFTLPSRADLIKQGAIHTRSQGPFYGEMNMFFYDAKYKKTLPYYDRFPLVIPILDASFKFNPKEEFIGINFHYLNHRSRIGLLNDLVQLYIENTELDYEGRESFTDKTRLVITNFSSLIAKTKQTKPCIKHYLKNHIKSNIRRIKSTEFILATLLPYEDFYSNNRVMSSANVWQDSESRFN